MRTLGTRGILMNIASSPRIERRFAGALVFLVCSTLFGFSLHAGETSDAKSTPSVAAEEEPAEGKNWIELGIGGLSISGDAAQFKQEHRMSGDIFGGIEDLHYEQT